jgi:MFS family permease
VAALALAVGLVLADSSIVVLALPEIYRELNTSIAGVTWVLVSFNLVIALAAVPAALVARRVGPARTAASSPSSSPGSRSSSCRCHWRWPPPCRSSRSPGTRRRPG